MMPMMKAGGGGFPNPRMEALDALQQRGAKKVMKRKAKKKAKKKTAKKMVPPPAAGARPY